MEHSLSWADVFCRVELLCFCASGGEHDFRQWRQ